MFTTRTAGLGLALCLGALAAHPAHAQFGTNLIVNGNAESGPGSASGSDIEPVPGFTTTGTFTVVQYGAPAGFPTATDPGPADRGANFFSGGPNAPFSSAFQLINLTSDAPVIDMGAATYDLSAYLGGFAEQEDNAVLTAAFESGAGTTLDTATLGPVLVTDRGSMTSLLFREATGAVPVGTRQVGVTLQMTRQGEVATNVFNDGYADNLSLVLKNNGSQPAVPEPGSFALLALGLPLAVLAARRRRA